MSIDLSKARVRTIVIGATAGNVATNLTPTLGKRWLFLYADITLVCDATVATRNIVPDITDNAGNTLTRFYEGANVAASGTTSIVFSPQLYQTAGLTVAVTHIGITPFVIDATDRFRIRIGAGVAGDSYTGNVKVVEI